MICSTTIDKHSIINRQLTVVNVVSCQILTEYNTDKLELGGIKMALTYKAVPYKPERNSKKYSEYEQLEDDFRQEDSEQRYCIISTETGEVLDDAQGYGYRTAQKAYAAYGYKTRDKSKDKDKQLKREQIKSWMKKHKSFVKLMDEEAFDIAKGSGAPDEEFDTAHVKELLERCNLEPDFKASELLKAWQCR